MRSVGADARIGPRHTGMCRVVIKRQMPLRPRHTKKRRPFPQERHFPIQNRSVQKPKNHPRRCAANCHHHNGGKNGRQPLPGQTGVIRRDVGLRLFAMLCRGLFCRGIPLLRQAEHLQKREKQHNFREDHRHANRNDRMGQVADQRQRDGRYAGAQPVLRGPAQVRNDKPQPRRQPGSAASIGLPPWV